ncbi:DUF421 domain-containing protein [Paenisporosarcina quisquiliarum]|uniref:DUF421 domain-containing protein n=1 Tax=Paenisporosarcina quisquiliarum TaxID=365346 RepID=A0A9X3LDZ9_9BACL|nr:DUF421 domain-containing protein [Paenisporosarcina quisquiliarum]MCZ8536143.1 DUF421 domain-containing protein [Paenisporosarcina quisquiliarum]
MSELFVVAWRTIFLYLLILFIFRIMGKREVGELSLMDLVIFVMIAEVASFAIDNPQRQLFESILPMILLLLIQLGTSYWSLKSKKIRDLIDGDPSVIIRNGEIIESEMRKQRYNLDDLFQQLREQQIGSIQDVSYAFLEPSGNLSVFKNDGDHPVLPLIVDGDVQESHLDLIQQDKEWLLDELKKIHIYDPRTVFYCSYEREKLYVQMRERFKSS